MRCMRYWCHSMFFFVSSALVLLCFSYQLFHGLIGSSVTLDIVGCCSCAVWDINAIVFLFLFVSSVLVLLCLSYQPFHSLIGSSVTLDIFGCHSCDVQDINVIVCLFFVSSALTNSFVHVYPCVRQFSLWSKVGTCAVFYYIVMCMDTDLLFITAQMITTWFSAADQASRTIISSSILLCKYSMFSHYLVCARTCAQHFTKWQSTCYDIFHCPPTPSGRQRHHFLGLMCMLVCCSFVIVLCHGLA